MRVYPSSCKNYVEKERKKLEECFEKKKERKKKGRLDDGMGAARISARTLYLYACRKFLLQLIVSKSLIGSSHAILAALQDQLREHLTPDLGLKDQSYTEWCYYSVAVVILRL